MCEYYNFYKAWCSLILKINLKLQKLEMALNGESRFYMCAQCPSLAGWFLHCSGPQRCSFPRIVSLRLDKQAHNKNLFGSLDSLESPHPFFKPERESGITKSLVNVY